MQASTRAAKRVAKAKATMTAWAARAAAQAMVAAKRKSGFKLAKIIRSVVKKGKANAD